MSFLKGLGGKKLLWILIGGIVGYMVDYIWWKMNLPGSGQIAFMIDESRGFGVGYDDLAQWGLWTGLAVFLKGRWRYFAIGGLFGGLFNKFALEGGGILASGA